MNSPDLKLIGLCVDALIDNHAKGLKHVGEMESNGKRCCLCVIEDTVCAYRGIPTARPTTGANYPLKSSLDALGVQGTHECADVGRIEYGTLHLSVPISMDPLFHPDRTLLCKVPAETLNDGGAYKWVDRSINYEARLAELPHDVIAQLLLNAAESDTAAHAFPGYYDARDGSWIPCTPSRVVDNLAVPV